MGGAAHLLQRLHPGLRQGLSLQLESPRGGGGGGGGSLMGSPRRVVCRICEEGVGREALQRHSRICAQLEAMCKQVAGTGREMPRQWSRSACICLVVLHCPA